jgi:2-dehydropantoate 2-reductase
MEKKNIAILGIGAVGGYIGALLAKKYFQSNEVNIIFIAREKTVSVIREKGLKLITSSAEKIVHPALASSDPAEVGKLDYLICCVKSYDLEESLSAYKDCITGKTIILPLLNGVDAKERIAAILPQAQVWEGCVYIISRLLEPGVIKESGNIHVFHFGSDSATEEKLEEFYRLLSDAGVDVKLSRQILLTTWEKFLFISVVASSTSYFDKTIGAVMENEDCRKVVSKLLSEIKALADARGIFFPDGIEERIIAKIESMPYDATSSMHSDFQKGGKTELRSLTEYVVKEGKRLGVKTPEYEMVLDALRNHSV